MLEFTLANLDFDLRTCWNKLLSSHEKVWSMVTRATAVSGLGGVMLLLLVGCGSGPSPAATSAEHLRQLARLCGNYASVHKGKMPTDVDELKKFAKTFDKSGADTDSFFVSPRDNEPYVLKLNVTMSMPGIGKKMLLAYEKTGVGGKRFVAYNTVEVEEVDEARFNELIAGK
ncbi:MAG: hypothetical protein NZO58_05140 [Gemmataceae bacterium]|nr:hypothetical protein [Gemmataceae bacterium]